MREGRLERGLNELEWATKKGMLMFHASEKNDP